MDVQVNPAHKNPSFRRGTHLTNQPTCLSHSSPSPLPGGELKAVEEQAAPMGEMQKKSSMWALIKMAWFPNQGDTPLVNCSCEHEVCKRTRAVKFAKPCIDERRLDPQLILMATFCKLPRCQGDRHPLPRANHRSPTGRTCWSLHRSLSHTRHVLFLCFSCFYIMLLPGASVPQEKPKTHPS